LEKFMMEFCKLVFCNNGEKEMTKEKQVTVKMDARQAAAVRQILFEAQKGYTYDEQSVPPRIADVREVVQQLDDNIGAVLGI